MQLFIFLNVKNFKTLIHMKKVTLIAILCLITSISFSQGISYGIKGGYNYSTVRANNQSLISGQNGFHAGVFANISAIILQVQPELLFSQKGYQVENGNDLRLNYIDIPLLLKVKVLPFVTVDAGPQYSYLINTKDINKDSNLPAMPSFNKSDLSAVIGGSVNFWKIGASLRYVHGFTEIEDFNQSKNSMFQLSLQLKL